MWAQIPTFRRLPDGTIETNPLKDYAAPFDLLVDNPNSVITLASNQQGLGLPMTARHDGPIEVFALKAIVLDSDNAPVTAHNVFFDLEHVGKRKKLNNRPIHLRSVQGDGGRPYILPETIWIPAVQSLFVRFYNNDLAERRVEFVLQGVKYYPHAAPDYLRKDIYSYTERRERTYCYFQTTNEDVTLAGSATGTQAFYTVPDDADLEIFKATAVSDAAFRIQHQDGQTDRAYSSALMHSSLFFGGFDASAVMFGAGGVFPNRWSTTLLVRRSIQNKFVMNNLSASENDIWITLGGRKISYV